MMTSPPPLLAWFASTSLQAALSTPRLYLGGSRRVCLNDVVPGGQEEGACQISMEKRREGDDLLVGTRTMRAPPTPAPRRLGEHPSSPVASPDGLGLHPSSRHSISGLGMHLSLPVVKKRRMSIVGEGKGVAGGGGGEGERRISIEKLLLTKEKGGAVDGGGEGEHWISAEKTPADGEEDEGMSAWRHVPLMGVMGQRHH